MHVVFVKRSLIADLLRNLSLTADAMENDHPSIQLDLHVAQGREANVHRRITGKTQKRYHILRCSRDE